MLNRSHALGSPLYNKLQQKLMAIAMGLHPELLNKFDWIVEGNKLINESETLGVENTLGDILKFIHHAKSSKLEVRSQVMLNAFSDERPI